MRIIKLMIFPQLALGFIGAIAFFQAVRPEPLRPGERVCGLYGLAILVYGVPFALGGLALGLAVGELLKQVAVMIADRRAHIDLKSRGED